jgi:hypothetical protein
VDEEYGNLVFLFPISFSTASKRKETLQKEEKVRAASIV